MARVLRWLVLCGGSGSVVAYGGSLLRWLASAVARVCGGSGFAVARVLRWLVLCGGSGGGLLWLGLCGGSARFGMTYNKGWMGRLGPLWLGFCGGSCSAVVLAYCGSGLRWLGLCGGSARFGMTY